MTTKADSGSWWELAACQTVSPELFFPVTETGPARMQVTRAKAICADCPVRPDCLRYAMSTHQVHGVWGGLSETERRALRAELANRQTAEVTWYPSAGTSPRAAADGSRPRPG
jgi:WhiB family transcriptional regulator, redox-sensing transcriptional regulator